MSEAFFSKAILEAISAIRLKFPPQKSRSALLMSLRAIQDEQGYLTSEHMRHLAELLNVSYMNVHEVAHFYSLFRHAPQGEVCVKVCQGLPCALNGARELLQALEQELGVRSGETTPDGAWTLKTTECQAACVSAPVVLMNDQTIESLSNQEDLIAWKKRWEPLSSSKDET